MCLIHLPIPPQAINKNVMSELSFQEKNDSDSPKMIHKWPTNIWMINITNH